MACQCTLLYTYTLDKSLFTRYCRNKRPCLTGHPVSLAVLDVLDELENNTALLAVDPQAENRFIREVVDNNPSRVHNNPSRVHNNPSRIHNNPSRIHNNPSRVHNNPSPVHNKPSRVHNNPYLVLF